MFRKSLVIILFLCAIRGSLSKPTATNELIEGRGIISTIWGYITYPFTFWRYSDSEPPTNDIGSTTYDPNGVIEIGKHNATIWCNDQTCTTMKCDKIGCRNISCSIYDTDMSGECRQYNTLNPEETPSPPVTPEPLEYKVTEYTRVPNVNPSLELTTVGSNPQGERLLALEEALSSTIETHPQTAIESTDGEKPHEKV